MSIYRNNLSPLPLYDSVEEQLHRRRYSYGYIYPLYVHPEKLIPFFTSWEGDSTGINLQKIEIYKVCNCGDTLFREIENLSGDYNLDFSRDFLVNSVGRDDFVYLNPVSLPDFSKYSALYYSGENPEVSWNLPRGQFYIKIILTDGHTFFSEVFTVLPEAELENNTIEVSWFDSKNLIYEGGYIPYSLGYKNKIYIPTEVGKPVYEYEEEGKNRGGYFFPEKQISNKSFSFTFVAPEFLYDSFRLVGLSDTVTVRDTLGRVQYPSYFTSEPEWLEEGYVAEIKCEYKTDTVIKTSGKPI